MIIRETITTPIYSGYGSNGYSLRTGANSVRPHSGALNVPDAASAAIVRLRVANDIKAAIKYSPGAKVLDPSVQMHSLMSASEGVTRISGGIATTQILRVEDIDIGIGE